MPVVRMLGEYVFALLSMTIAHHLEVESTLSLSIRVDFSSASYIV